MNNNKFPPLKAGGTFSYAGACQLPAGDWSATCQVRSQSNELALKNLGAIVATTPTQVDLFLCVNGAGVTLVGNLNRKYLGTQTFAVGAAIGSGAIEGPIALDLSEADLITEAGRVISLVARVSTGTATASQVLEVMYTNLGHFE